jgi:Zn-dependent peptidase ImmA (M78 family)/transcriptional regulator with XRE-family HTH domain
MEKNDFFGDKLRLARLLKGITQQQLGTLVSTTRQYIHQLESGSRQPAEDVLSALCESLAVTPFFFTSQLGNDVKPEQCHFRKRKTTPVGLANRVLAYSTIFEQVITYLQKYVDLPSPNFPEMDNNNIKYSTTEIEQAAESCRRLWGLGISAPVSNVTRALENNGVIITQFAGISDKVDALSINRKYPIIVRNDAKPSVCRMRFDLAHELGHFILHEGIETGDPQTESEADKFASAFLFPRVAFNKEFPDFRGYRLNWKIIYDLKIRWKLSARAIIYRAHYFEFITAQQYRGANVWLNKTGQSKKERYDELIQQEPPELLQNAINLLDQQLGGSFKHIADKLGIHPELLSQITGITYNVEGSHNNIVPLF